MTVSFIIPGPPVGKGRPRFNRMTGRAYTPEKTASYENLVKVEYERAGGRQYSDSAELGMNIASYFPIPTSVGKRVREKMLEGKIRPTKKPDVDNIAKVIADSLNGIAYRDDTQITNLIVNKWYAETARTEVTIWEE
jgi:Holliday junction resolvase RusA-like endonuclease